jgi:2-polyprenyl-3-methyl-5-hydroxy-6-metoxy-1,4-benzoquinol methylase
VNPQSKPSAAEGESVDFYTATYGRFNQSIYQDIRRETWDQDIGQNSWLTAAEQDRFIQWLALAPGQRLLDVACGSGGPALRIAERSRARVTGIDIHADGIASARSQTHQRGLADLASFEVVDAGSALHFETASFDALTCIDAINHLPDRPRVLAEWARVLKPGGRLLFTDPIVVTGPLTSQEIATRSSIGYFLFVARDTNDRMLKDAGLQLISSHDLTDALAQSASAWHAARQKRAAQLRAIEGDATFDGQQRFLDVAARIARNRSLSRLAYLAIKPA